MDESDEDIRQRALCLKVGHELVALSLAPGRFDWRRVKVVRDELVIGMRTKKQLEKQTTDLIKRARKLGAFQHVFKEKP